MSTSMVPRSTAIPDEDDIALLNPKSYRAGTNGNC
jgi:hypothetical protein